jgi:ribose transport system ATP-binding protein
LRALRTRPTNPDRMARELSGGNQQKVVLGRWLLRKCKVLLLDEPTRGVDVETKTELYRIIAGLAEQGLGVLVVSSEIGELLGMCTRILVMREGELVADLDGSTATELDVLRHAMPGTQQMVTAGAPTEEE